jgi:hypothetical protein
MPGEVYHSNVLFNLKFNEERRKCVRMTVRSKNMKRRHFKLIVDKMMTIMRTALQACGGAKCRSPCILNTITHWRKTET